MDRITLVFTKRTLNPVSWLIRWALPISRFSMARASHCMIVDGDHVIEATMLQGVRRVPRKVALEGSVVVGQVAFTVPCAEKGLDWARGQVGRPYDYAGAFGLAIAPDRSWMEDDAWFCFELGAASLAVAGREVFEVAGHVNGTMLMAVRP